MKISDIPGLETDGTLGTSANFLLFMMSLVFGMVWITYITFFNSRLVARFVTKIANRIVGGNGGGYFKVGSLSWAVLPGKIMFRDVCYVTADYTVRIQDGYVVFRWWRRYVPKYDADATAAGAGDRDGHSTSSGHAKDNTRVSVQLNGLELHTYNRTSVYRELGKTFGYESTYFDLGGGGGKGNGYEDGASGSGGDDDENSSSSSYILGKKWRDLIPVIKVDMSTAKLVFGNRLLPTTLVVSADEAHCTYSTKTAGCSLDHFMHFVKLRAENFKVSCYGRSGSIAQSPSNSGIAWESSIVTPPRNGS